MTAPATLPDVDAMEAGPEMDALIAEARGLVVDSREIKNGFGTTIDILRSVRHEPPEIGDPRSLPPYSTDDATALEMLKTLPAASLHWFREHGEHPLMVKVQMKPDGPEVRGFGPTLALAGCRAALKASLT
jgi:hypothetical protein